MLRGPINMKTAKIPHDPLFELERKIARRADELSRQLGTDREHALEHWKQAEREVWKDYASGHAPYAERLAQTCG